MTQWFVYILECGDGSYYTGCTTNVKKRVLTHSQGKGATYTKTHLPVKLVYVERLRDRSTALRREAAIKSLRRSKKIGLIKTFYTI